MSVTLTQVLTRRNAVRLYGQRVSDLSPRGGLGLPLDPDGPVGFAVVRAFHRDGVTTLLRPPQLLSVHGEGRCPEPGDAGAMADEQVWTASAHDPTLCMTLQRGPLQTLLADGTADGAADPGTC